MSMTTEESASGLSIRSRLAAPHLVWCGASAKSSPDLFPPSSLLNRPDSGWYRDVFPMEVLNLRTTLLLITRQHGFIRFESRRNKSSVHICKSPEVCFAIFPYVAPQAFPDPSVLRRIVCPPFDPTEVNCARTPYLVPLDIQCNFRMRDHPNR